MTYEARIIADSISPAGARLTTIQARLPKYLLAQVNTHRALSKNARSSRAVPVTRMLEEVTSDPVLPIRWGTTRKGMTAGPEMGERSRDYCVADVDALRRETLATVARLAMRRAAKEIANRYLEPFAWADVLLSGTSAAWVNFFALRCKADAQPEMTRAAVLIARAYRDSTPYPLLSFMWHLPYVTPEELAWLCSLRNGQDAMMERVVEAELIRASVARCARISYAPHDGKPASLADEKARADRLEADMHVSPFEHQARPFDDPTQRSGNLVGFEQYRQLLPRSVYTAFDFATLDQFA